MVSSTTEYNLPTLSAEDLHKILIEAFRIGNEARHRFVETFFHVAKGELWKKLGGTSLYAYAKKHFFMSSTETKESLRVAEALLSLHPTGEAFDRGEVSWSHIIEVTRIATPGTEATWMDFARAHSVLQTRAEVQKAIDDGRDVPREDRYGIPSITLPVNLRLDLEEHEFLMNVFSQLRRELRESLGEDAENLSVKDIILYMARCMKKTRPDGMPDGRTERDEPLYDILFRCCPGCGKTHYHTAEGLVEVPYEHVLQIWADARKTTIRPEEEVEVKGEAVKDGAIDGKNTASIVRKVRARDGDRCANPHCRCRLGIHVHHVIFRNDGGPTALYNLISCCSRCHALYAQRDVMLS